MRRLLYIIISLTALTLSARAQNPGNAFDRELQESALKLGMAGDYEIEDWIQYLPAAAYFGLGFVNSMGEHSTLERAMVLGTSWVGMAAVVAGTKYVVKRERPDGSNFKSMPSGHASRAFMGAELIRLEYGSWWGLGAYTVATGTAALRVCHNRHWGTDVLVGAGIGVLSAEIAWWLLPLEKKTLGLQRAGKSLAATPWYDGMGSFGCSLALVF